MNKKTVAFIILIIMNLAGMAFAEGGDFELGGGLGTPSGLNVRYWFTNRIGLDALGGLSMDMYPVFTMDLLVDAYTLYSSRTLESRFFIGLGGLAAKEEDGFKKNIRIPVGLSFPFLRYPLNFSFYVAPAFAVNSSERYEVNWGIGIRYNFTRARAMRSRQDDLEWKVGGLEANVEDLKYGLDKTKGRLSQTEGELSATKGKLERTEGELGIVKGRLDEMTGKLTVIKQRLDKTEGELGSAKNQLTVRTKELDETKNQLDDVKSELNNTKKTLDDKQVELDKKQTELDNVKNIVENAFTGKEKEEEQKKLGEKQKDLNDQFVQLKNEKQVWEKIKEKENERREQLRKKCEDRGGIIDENGYCTCPEHQEWDQKTDKCVCVKGYSRKKSTGDCEACETIKQSGDCAGGCEDYEEKVPLKGSPHKYVCVKKCRKANELWSKKKNTCVCKDGYYRNEAGDCVPRQ